MTTNEYSRSACGAALLIWITFAQLAQAYYNPSAGRWLSRDPIEERGGVNICSFVANNPASHLDLLGLEEFCTTWSVPDGHPIDAVPNRPNGGRYEIARLKACLDLDATACLCKKSGCDGDVKIQLTVTIYAPRRTFTGMTLTTSAFGLNGGNEGEVSKFAIDQLPQNLQARYRTAFKSSLKLTTLKCSGEKRKGQVGINNNQGAGTTRHMTINYSVDVEDCGQATGGVTSVVANQVAGGQEGDLDAIQVTDTNSGYLQF